MKIWIEVSGGLVQSVLADEELSGVDVVVIDFDAAKEDEEYAESAQYDWAEATEKGVQVW